MASVEVSELSKANMTIAVFVETREQVFYCVKIFNAEFLHNFLGNLQFTDYKASREHIL